MLSWLDDANLYELHRYKWIQHEARHNQLTPEGAWNVWMLLAGRGFGKTRTAAEDIAWYAWTNPGSRIAVVAETFADGRDVCMEGDSGLLNVLGDDAIAHWNRSMGEMLLVNGSRLKVYSGDKPDMLRGPQFHRAWLDELAKFKYARETWDQLMFGLRLGEKPQALVTTTPRPIEVIRELVGREDVHITTGTTFDNAANLSSSALRSLEERYAGTRLGRQELSGEILTDVPGALWSRGMIERTRTKQMPAMARIVVAIDPAVTSGEESDETGLVVAGKGVDGRGYVLDDRSGRHTPDEWARLAVDLYRQWQADRVVAEVNNGGDLVERIVRGFAPNLSYKKVTASRGKRVRAEPVSAMYEQGRISHVGSFPQLEDQMVSFVPDMAESPDRVDALVWAITDLFFGNRGTRKVRVHR